MIVLNFDSWDEFDNLIPDVVRLAETVAKEEQ